MPKPGEYTPARRNLMQAIVWVIFGIIVALAAIVTRAQRQAGQVELASQTVSSGNVSVRLPSRWRARMRGDTDSRMIAQAAESAPGEGGRTVRVLSDRIDQPLSPLRYICQTFGVSAARSDMDEPEGVAIGGYPGIMVTLESGRFTRRGPDVRKDIYACAVLPSLQVLTVHLSGEGPMDMTDQAVVGQIASAIAITSPPQMEPQGASLTLPEGITISPPADFAAVTNADPKRSDRRLWLLIPEKSAKQGGQLEKSFVSIEVVGCLFPSIAQNDVKRADRARSALVTMLLLRDQQWRDAKVVDENGAWRADMPQISEEQQFPARAYLMPDPASGRALLTVFTGGLAGGASFDRCWKEMSAKVKFLPASDSSQLEDAGAAEAARLMREANFDKLLDDRDDQWFQWLDASDRPHRGWSHLEWAHDGIKVKGETRMRSAGEVVREQRDWTLQADGRQYFSDTRRVLKVDEEEQTLRQVCNLKAGQISLNVQSQSNTIAQWKLPAPAQYLPGQLIVQLMGKLSPGPMLLKTESFLDAETVGPLEPLSVIIRPAPPSTRKAEGDDQPLRCVTAQVNGSGRVSRWYFRDNGELESVELPGGVRRVESDLGAIRMDFGMNGQMAP